MGPILGRASPNKGLELGDGDAAESMFPSSQAPCMGQGLGLPPWAMDTRARSAWVLALEKSLSPA